MVCARPAAGPRCAGTSPGRPRGACWGTAGGDRQGEHRGVCGPRRGRVDRAGEASSTATPPVAGAQCAPTRLGRPESTCHPSEDGSERAGCPRLPLGRAVRVRRGQRGVQAVLEVAEHRGRAETRPRSGRWGPRPAALRRPPAGGQARGQLLPPIVGSTTSSGSCRAVSLPTYRSVRTAVLPPLPPATPPRTAVSHRHPRRKCCARRRERATPLARASSRRSWSPRLSRTSDRPCWGRRLRRDRSRHRRASRVRASYRGYLRARSQRPRAHPRTTHRPARRRRGPQLRPGPSRPTVARAGPRVPGPRRTFLPP
jgi:hypothetical protein